MYQTRAVTSSNAVVLCYFCSNAYELVDNKIMFRRPQCRISWTSIQALLIDKLLVICCKMSTCHWRRACQVILSMELMKKNIYEVLRSDFTLNCVMDLPTLMKVRSYVVNVVLITHYFLCSLQKAEKLLQYETMIRYDQSVVIFIFY